MRKLTILVSFLGMVSAVSVAQAQAGGGKATYDKMCASCHGPDGSGNAAKAKAFKLDPNQLNLGRPETASLTPEDRKKILTEGKGKMPAYKPPKLKAEDLEPLFAYQEELIKALRAKK